MTSRTVYSVGEALRQKPDCARCGQPYHRHNVGTVTSCPIIPVYVPKDATMTEEQREAIARLRETILAVEWHRHNPMSANGELIPDDTPERFVRHYVANAPRR